MLSSEYKIYRLIPYDEVIKLSSSKSRPGINVEMICKFNKDIELKKCPHHSDKDYYVCRDGWNWHHEWIIKERVLKEFDSLLKDIQCL